MNIICKPRGCGKTYDLTMESARTGNPIVTSMKPEEAIDIIKRMHKGALTTDQYEALEMSYEALEKQIPKIAPRIIGALGGKYECPECGSELGDIDVFKEHCGWCGQAILDPHFQ